MRILSILLLLLGLSFISCKEKSTTVNGYKFSRYNASSSGKKPAAGDFAFIHIYYYQDSVLMTSTRENNRVMPVKVYGEEELKTMATSGKPNPVYEAVSVMSVGDSIRINVPITEEMKKDVRLAQAKEIYYNVVMVDAKTEDEYKAEQQAERERLEKQETESRGRATEVASLATDLAAQYRVGKLNDKIKTTASGLKYLILEEGTGQPKQKGGTAQVHYYGMLTNGTMFDNSFDRGQPYSFPLGAGRVIKGWDEGVALLKGGDKAVLFIPSELGYGKGGGGAKIPGDSELIFYIEVL